MLVLPIPIVLRRMLVEVLIILRIKELIIPLIMTLRWKRRLLLLLLVFKLLLSSFLLIIE